MAAGTLIATQRPQVAVSAPVRGLPQPCGGAPSGGANWPCVNRGPGDAHGRRIPLPPTAGSTLAPRGAPEGRRPGTPISADPPLGGRVPFPRCTNARIFRAPLSIRPSGYVASTLTGATEPPACSCIAGQGAPSVLRKPVGAAVPSRRPRGAPGRSGAHWLLVIPALARPGLSVAPASGGAARLGVRSAHALQARAPSA